MGSVLCKLKGFPGHKGRRLFTQVDDDVKDSALRARMHESSAACNSKKFDNTLTHCTNFP